MKFIYPDACNCSGGCSLDRTDIFLMLDIAWYTAFSVEFGKNGANVRYSVLRHIWSNSSPLLELFFLLFSCTHTQSSTRVCGRLLRDLAPTSIREQCWPFLIFFHFLSCRPLRLSLSKSFYCLHSQQEKKSKSAREQESKRASKIYYIHRLESTKSNLSCQLFQVVRNCLMR